MSDGTTAASQVAEAVVKATPPTVVTGATILGYSPAEWVCFATFIYTLLQIHFLLKKNSELYRKLFSKLTGGYNDTRAKRK